MFNNVDEVLALPVGDVTISGFITSEDLACIERGEHVEVTIYHAVGAGVELGTLHAIFEAGALQRGPVPFDLAL